jgi:hypothetical protein
MAKANNISGEIFQILLFPYPVLHCIMILKNEMSLSSLSDTGDQIVLHKTASFVPIMKTTNGNRREKFFN